MTRRNFERGDFIRGGSHRADPEHKPNIPRPTIEKALIRKGCWMTSGPPRPSTIDDDEDTEALDQLQHSRRQLQLQKQQFATVEAQVRALLEKVKGMVK